MRQGIEISEIKVKLEKATEQLTNSETKISALIASGTLKECDPYPLGIDLVKVGDPMSKVIETYNENEYEIEKTRGYFSVAFPNNKAFRSASYITAGQSGVVGVLIFYSGVKHLDPKETLKSSPQQEGFLVQVRNAFPKAKVSLRNDQDDPGYDVELDGKIIMEVNPNSYVIRRNQTEIRQACNKIR
ncbi:hypothetical protein IFT80_21410 [Pseudomonas sp. CFBP 8771]|uniref:hypothetical protein n=1 Tax=Pseudomonas sp. CFBP 8771 TaxID=2775285 RepID=UPI00177C3FE7|nr:hypothetical protein [Pseudomonas sp. CFBP 8771]MBD8605196.1 hypothetical protein [Pseudomonas sp. CFBP 8771]